MAPGAYVWTFLASALATLAAVPVIGNSLPGRSGAYVPMHVGRDVIRDEFVAQHALREMRQPCVGFFGDSRTAFNISAALVDRSLPSGCGAQNYGFASLALPQVKRLIDQSGAAETIVVSVSETMVQTQSLDVRLDAILSDSLIRYLYLGHQRILHVIKRVNRTSPPDDGWRWSRDEKRWIMLPLRTRILNRLATLEVELAALAANYFATREPGDGSELREFLSWASTKAKRLVIVLPPSAIAFQDAATKFDKQPLFWQLIKREARLAQADVIDCSNSCVDESGFADPVHLNDEGAREYSSEIANRLRQILAGR